MRKDERAFEECVRELWEVGNSIEGPLQKIIENSAKKMDICRLKYIPYTSIRTEFNHVDTSKQNIFSKALKWLSNLDKSTIISGFIVGVALLWKNISLDGIVN